VIGAASDATAFFGRHGGAFGLEVGRKNHTLAHRRTRHEPCSIAVKCCRCPAALGGFLGREVDLAQPPVKIGDGGGLNVDPGCKRGICVSTADAPTWAATSWA
jgi:hypothetical protein